MAYVTLLSAMRVKCRFLSTPRACLKSNPELRRRSNFQADLGHRPGWWQGGREFTRARAPCLARARSYLFPGGARRAGRPSSPPEQSNAPVNLRRVGERDARA